MGAPLPRRVLDSKGDIDRLNQMCTNFSYDVFAFLSAIRAGTEIGLSADIETTLTAIEALLTTLNGLVSTAALQMSGNSSLTSIATNTGNTATNTTNVNPATFVAPFQTSTGGSATQLASNVIVAGAWVKNISTGGQVVYVGRSNAVTTGTGYQLLPGVERFFSCRNTNEIWIIASAASANTCCEPI